MQGLAEPGSVPCVPAAPGTSLGLPKSGRGSPEFPFFPTFFPSLPHYQFHPILPRAMGSLLSFLLFPPSSLYFFPSFSPIFRFIQLWMHTGRSLDIDPAFFHVIKPSVLMPWRFSIQLGRIMDGRRKNTSSSAGMRQPERFPPTCPRFLMDNRRQSSFQTSSKQFGRASPTPASNLAAAPLGNHFCWNS